MTGIGLRVPLPCTATIENWGFLASLLQMAHTALQLPWQPDVILVRQGDNIDPAWHLAQKEQKVLSGPQAGTLQKPNLDIRMGTLESVQNCERVIS